MKNELREAEAIIENVLLGPANGLTILQAWQIARNLHKALSALHEAKQIDSEAEVSILRSENEVKQNGLR